MPAGLAVSDVVSVTVNMEPTAVPTRNFGALLIAGPSAVIDTKERLRLYATLDQVAGDFGTTAPEYLAADLAFSQSPQPALCYIGRWAQSPTSGVLHSAIWTQAQQNVLLAQLPLITDGSFTISVDGTAHAVANLDFTAQSRTSTAPRPSSAPASHPPTSCGMPAPAGSTSPARLRVSTRPSAMRHPRVPALICPRCSASRPHRVLPPPVAGMISETPLACAQALGSVSGDWYGLVFAPTAASDITDAQHQAVASYIEGSVPSRIYAVTTSEAGALDLTNTTDLASLMSGLGLKRTFVQYSSSNRFAATSAFARGFSTDFTANNSTITLKFKQEPSVTAETLSETQAAALKTKHCNVFINYQNSAAIIQEGVMANGFFFDEVQGTDWLQNNVQTAVFNLLYGSNKIPQTDAGVHQIATVVEAALADGVNNGLIAPGVWTGPSVGQLNTGSTMNKGYYVYAPPISSQNAADRAARKAPTIIAAIKLAGAVHSAAVIISVNR